MANNQPSKFITVLKKIGLFLLPWAVAISLLCILWLLIWFISLLFADSNATANWVLVGLGLVVGVPFCTNFASRLVKKSTGIAVIVLLSALILLVVIGIISLLV